MPVARFVLPRMDSSTLSLFLQETLYYHITHFIPEPQEHIRMKSAVNINTVEK